jgi:hypothetical protein
MKPKSGRAAHASRDASLSFDQDTGLLRWPSVEKEGGMFACARRWSSVDLLQHYLVGSTKKLSSIGHAFPDRPSPSPTRSAERKLLSTGILFAPAEVYETPSRAGTLGESGRLGHT